MYYATRTQRVKHHTTSSLYTYLFNYFMYNSMYKKGKVEKGISLLLLSWSLSVSEQGMGKQMVSIHEAEQKRNLIRMMNFSACLFIKVKCLWKKCNMSMLVYLCVSFMKNDNIDLCTCIYRLKSWFVKPRLNWLNAWHKILENTFFEGDFEIWDIHKIKM